MILLSVPSPLSMKYNGNNYSHLHLYIDLQGYIAAACCLLLRVYIIIQYRPLKWHRFHWKRKQATPVEQPLLKEACTHFQT